MLNPMATLGKRLKQVRKERGLTQHDLARRVCKINPLLSTKHTTISSIERGQSEAPTILNELAIALGVTDTWLRTGKGQKESKAVTVQEIGLLLEQFRESLIGALEATGHSSDDANEIAQLIFECAQDSQADGEAADLRYRRMISATLVRRFLQAKKLQT